MIDETIEEIREMRTHSSSVVAVKATQALTDLVDREFASVEEYERSLEQNAGALRRANPSHASLYNAMRAIEREVVGNATTVEEARKLTLHAIERIVDGIDRGKARAAANAADTFEDGEVFLTHDYSSTVLEAVETTVDEGKELTAYVTEARPRYLGRKSARAFAGIEGIEPHLLVDSASGYVLPQVDRVIIGMSCIVDGTLHNRVGTFPLVAAANQVGVPVTVVGSGAKIVDDGFRFENEIRSGSEVMLEPIEGIVVENPSYDATPVELIDQVITDEGVEEF